MPFQLQIKDQLRQFTRPAVMGVINASPNSFYGVADSLDSALKQAEQMVAAGVDIIDVGGEATNPKVDIAREKPALQEEIDRAAPVIEAIKQQFDVLVSLDSSEPMVMQACIEAGVDILNDQRSLALPGAKELVLKHQVPVVLMHNFEPIRTPGSSTAAELLQAICQGFEQQTAELIAEGLSADYIIVDPGFGQGNYGKNVEENYYLLRHLDQLAKLGFPVLAGWSRKSMIGDVLGGVPPSERLYGSIAAAVLAVERGASIVRVHDVGATVDAIKVWQACQQA